jgi:hypothetical protein
MGRTACTEPQCLYKGDLHLTWSPYKQTSVGCSSYVQLWATRICFVAVGNTEAPKGKYRHYQSWGVSSYEISNIYNFYRTTFLKSQSNLSFCKWKRHNTNVAEEYCWAIHLRRDGNEAADRVPVRRSWISTDSLLYTYIIDDTRTEFQLAQNSNCDRPSGR